MALRFRGTRSTRGALVLFALGAVFVHSRNTREVLHAALDAVSSNLADQYRVNRGVGKTIEMMDQIDTHRGRQIETVRDSIATLELRVATVERAIRRSHPGPVAA